MEYKITNTARYDKKNNKYETEILLQKIMLACEVYPQFFIKLNKKKTKQNNIICKKCTVIIKTK